MRIWNWKGRTTAEVGDDIIHTYCSSEETIIYRKKVRINPLLFTAGRTRYKLPDARTRRRGLTSIGPIPDRLSSHITLGRRVLYHITAQYPWSDMFCEHMQRWKKCLRSCIGTNSGEVYVSKKKSGEVYGYNNHVTYMMEATSRYAHAYIYEMEVCTWQTVIKTDATATYIMQTMLVLTYMVKNWRDVFNQELAATSLLLTLTASPFLIYMKEILSSLFFSCFSASSSSISKPSLLLTPTHRSVPKNGGARRRATTKLGPLLSSA